MSLSEREKNDGGTRESRASKVQMIMEQSGMVKSEKWENPTMPGRVGSIGYPCLGEGE